MTTTASVKHPDLILTSEDAQEAEERELREMFSDAVVALRKPKRQMTVADLFERSRRSKKRK